MDIVALASDSMTALHMLSNCSRGAPAQPGIEKRMKDVIAHDTGILWVYGHIGTVMLHYKKLLGITMEFLIT